MLSYRSHPLWLRIALGGIGISLYAVAVPVDSTLYQVPVALAFLFCLFTSGALPLTLVAPRTAIALFAAGALGTAVFSGAGRAAGWPWPLPVTSIIAVTFLVSLVTFLLGWRAGLVAWVVVFAIVVAAQPLTGTGVFDSAADIIVAFSISLVGAVVALLLAGRNRIRDELEREKEISSDEQARRLVVEERARIARELHDVVAHSMSIIQVQASTARYRLPGIEERAVQEFDDIAASARTALGEMRRLLGALRTDGSEAERLPQQTLDDVPHLIESVRRAGVTIDFSLDDRARQVPPSVQVIVFRLVQEAISNAVRHAPGSRISVVIGAEMASAVVVTVLNSSGRTPSSNTGGGGHGIVGMRERTAMLGGTLEAHATGDGGWVVRAVVPYSEVSEASAPVEGTP